MLGRHTAGRWRPGLGWAWMQVARSGTEEEARAEGKGGHGSGTEGCSGKRPRPHRCFHSRPDGRQSPPISRQGASTAPPTGTPAQGAVFRGPAWGQGTGLLRGAGWQRPPRMAGSLRPHSVAQPARAPSQPALHAWSLSRARLLLPFHHPHSGQRSESVLGRDLSEPVKGKKLGDEGVDICYGLHGAPIPQ